MKRVLLPIIAVAAALGLYMLLVPNAQEPGREYRYSKSPEVAGVQRVYDAQRDSIYVLQDARDRLLALETARRLPRLRAGLVISAEAGIPEGSRVAFEQMARRELADLGDAIRHPVRIHLVRDTLSAGGYGRMVVMPSTADEPCAVIVLVGGSSMGDETPSAEQQIVGTCGFYATFGTPGPGMLRWLIDTRGVHSASYLAPPPFTPGHKERLSAANVGDSPSVYACLAGNDDACIRSWRQPNMRSRDAAANDSLREVTRGTVLMSASPPRWGYGGNLSNLRDAMTDARFAELWRSEKHPAEAYFDIEGEHLGNFVRSRLLSDLEPYRPGPIHADLSLALGIAMGIVAAVLSVLFTKRQRS